MLLNNRVHETSTTTGTGNITLAGAVSAMQSFNSAFGLNRRFTYWIDNGGTEWETGIGYLSGTTTLVRETPKDGSASTPVSFTGGALDVFVAANQSQSMPTFGQMESNAQIVSANQGDSTDTQALVGGADSIQYMPFLWLGDQAFDGIRVRCQTTVGTVFRMGLYENVDGAPTDLIVSTGDLTPAVANIIGSISSTTLPVGWYWIAIVSDGADSFKGTNRAGVIQNPMGTSPLSSEHLNFQLFTESAPSWTVLPASAGTLVKSSGNNNAGIRMALVLV